MKAKENKAMRFASVLLVLTLLVTSLTAGTFAKYTTEESGSAEARVAKFGVDVSVDTANLFGGKYKSADGVVSTNEDGISVKASDDKMVVAPGTKGFMTFSATGTPETKVQVKIGLTNSNSVMLKAGTYMNGDKEVTVTGDYSPVKWTLAGADGQNVSGCEDTTLDVINTYLSGDTFTKEYNAGTNLESNIKYTLSWEWAYGEADVNAANADTILGDLAAGATDITKKDGGTVSDGTDYNLTESFDFNISVTQVD